MAKKRNPKSDDIGMAYSVEGPRGMTRAAVYRAMLDGLREKTGNLPRGVKVTWKWRNSKKQDMREDTFKRAIRKSREGFLALMERRILRDASRLPNWDAFNPLPPPVTHKARKKAAEKAAAKKQALKTSRKPKAAAVAKAPSAATLKRKRSAAARKGWITRRANAAAASKKQTNKRGPK